MDPLDDPPGDPRGFGLKVCTSCKAGDHAGCGPFVQHARQRLLYCECGGWDRQNGQLVILPCITTEETP